MQRANSLALLVLSLFLLGASVHGQRGFGRVPSVGASHFGPRVFPGPRGARALFGRHFHRERAFASDVFVGPLWFDDGWFEGGYYQDGAVPPDTMTASSPRIIITEPPSQAAPPATPHIIEIPGVASAARAQPSAVFVLRDGQTLESGRYLLTSESVKLTTERQERTIPLSQLDVAATLQANRARGIDLKMPADRNEITLAF